MNPSRVDRRRRFSNSPLETLEPRCLLSATLLSKIPSQTVFTANGASQINLGAYFNDPSITGSLVRLSTNFGNIDLELFDSQKPISVANFLMYVNDGTYNNTVIHRSANLFSDANSATPVQIIQGGAFSDNAFSSIISSSTPGITNEASTNGVISNLTGTIAYARGTDPNSATSQWFINVTDNPVLDPQPGNSNASTAAGYATFGKVIDGTLSTVDAMAAVPRYDLSGFSTSTYANASALSQIPIQNYSQADATAMDQPSASDLEVINTATVIPKLTYSVTSSNPNAIQPSVTNGVLTLTPVASAGSATITVTATDINGKTATSTFSANVTNGNSASVTLGAGGAKSVTYTDTDGTTGTFKLSGPGSATIDFSGSGLNPVTTKSGVVVQSTTDSVSEIDFSNTTSASTLTITTTKGTKAIDIGVINVSTDLKGIIAKGVTLTGDLTTNNNIGSLVLAGAEGGAIAANSIGTLTVSGVMSDDLRLGSSGVSLNKFTGGTIVDGTWGTSGSVNSISATAASDWDATFTDALTTLKITGDLTGVFRVPSIKTLNVTGTMTATIVTNSIGTLMDRGGITSSTLEIQGSGTGLGKLIVNGSIDNSEVNVMGNIGAVTAGSLVDSEIYAGIVNLVVGQTAPNSSTDFLPASSIRSVSLKSSSGNAFSNSEIASSTLFNLSLGSVLTDDNGMSTGVASGGIGSFLANANGDRISLRDVTASTPISDTITSELGDFKIALFS